MDRGGGRGAGGGMNMLCFQKSLIVQRVPFKDKDRGRSGEGGGLSVTLVEENTVAQASGEK